MRADGVRTVVWVTPWVNLDSRDGQIPPQPESERLHREPASNYAPGAAAGHFVADRGRRAVRHAVVDGNRLAGRLHEPGRRGVVARAGHAACSSSASRGSRPTTARATTSRTHVRLADGRTGAAGGVGARRPAPRVPPARARRGPSRARRAVRRAAAGPGSTPSATPGAAIRPRTSGRCACWSWRRCRPPAAASRTGRTTSAATSGTGWSSAARPSCSCAGSSSAASRR